MQQKLVEAAPQKRIEDGFVRHFALADSMNEAEAIGSNAVQMQPVINAINQYYNTLPPAPGY